MIDDSLFRDDPILRGPDARKYIGCGHTKFHDLIKEGLLPKGIVLGERARGWRRSTLNAYLSECERRTQEAVQ